MLFVSALEREQVSGMAQIGNQVAYAEDSEGSKRFFRITFTGVQGKPAQPAMQVSGDCLRWSSPEGVLAGDNARGCYFLGISTIDGTCWREQERTPTVPFMPRQHRNLL